jgi:hypothetical protein
MTIFCGLDLATQTGFAYGRPDTTPHCGTVRAPSSGKDLGAFASFYMNYFRNLVYSLQARSVDHEEIIFCYEAPLLPEKTTIETTRKLHGLGLLLEGIVAEAEDETPGKFKIFECYLGTIKKELAGSGKAEKADMVFAARRAGISLPEGAEAQDAADALGAWLVAIRKCGTRAEQNYWDRRVHGGFKAILEG